MFTGISCMSVMANLLRSGCFATGYLANGCFFLAQMYVSIALHRSVKEIIDSLPRAQRRLRQEFNVSVSLQKKGVFVCVCHNQSGYLTFRMTKVKDTKLIIAFRLKQDKTTPFSVTNIQEKSCQVSVPIIPWLISELFPVTLQTPDKLY